MQSHPLRTLQMYAYLAIVFGKDCKSEVNFGCTDVWVEVLNASRNAITSVSEISSLVELRALILNSEFTYSVPMASYRCAPN